MFPIPLLRKIERHLYAHDQVPLFGLSPPFDWERFTASAASRFAIPSLTFKAESQQWLSHKELKKGLGRNIVTIPVKVGPLAGSAFWMMPREEVGKITSWMLYGKAKTKPFASEILAEGFYRYLLLQILDVSSDLEPLNTLSLMISEESELPETDALCIDIEIGFENRSCWGRLAIDPELQTSWKAHFANFPSEVTNTKRAQSIELDLGVKVGSVLLHGSEFKAIKEGDIVLLDKGSYDPRKATGAAYFTLGPTPLFQIKIKHNKLELLDYAFAYEDEMTQKKNLGHEDSLSLPPSEGEIVSIKETPVYVTVELARFKITLEKLMQLQPGNLIELPVTPEQIVQLTVNGQLVGRAELVHLGEALGVRILEL